MSGSDPRTTLNPFYFGTGETRLFGALHASTTGSRGRGAILCPPFGFESQTSHRAFRHLADALAAAGVNVLRFDYRGTGDSAGDAEHASLNAWVADAATAIDELQAITPTKTIALVGLRVGASVACRLAVSNPAIDRLILWSPVVDGARYLAGLEAHQAALERADRLLHHWDRRGSRDLLGYALSDSMEEDLRSIDLRDLDVPKRVKALLLTTPADSAISLAALEPAFSHLDTELIPGPERWLDSIDLGSGESIRGPGFVPVDVIRVVTEWLSET